MDATHGAWIADDGAAVWLNGQRVIVDNLPGGPIGYSTLSLVGRWGPAESTAQQFVLPPTELVAGANTIAIEVHQRDPWSSDLSFDARLRLTAEGSSTTTTTPTSTTTTTTTSPTTTTTSTSTTTTTTTTPPEIDPNPIALGSIWHYQAAGIESPGWQQPDFDDTAWPVGAAELGFGDGDEATTYTRNLGGRGLITAYFRQRFGVGSPDSVTGATVSILADDSAVVWLNGHRVVSDNITGGPVAYETFSSSGRWGPSESLVRRFDIDPALLVVGDNVLAVEVHQREEWSSDMSFDAALELRTN